MALALVISIVYSKINTHRITVLDQPGSSLPKCLLILLCVCLCADRSFPILLKTGNAFFSNATPSDPKHIEEPFKVEAETVKVTPPSPDKVMTSLSVQFLTDQDILLSV